MNSYLSSLGLSSKGIGPFVRAQELDDGATGGCGEAAEEALTRRSGGGVELDGSAELSFLQSRCFLLLQLDPERHTILAW